MSGTEIAALIVAIGGAIGAVLAGLRNLFSDRFRRDVDQGAQLLTGYVGMVERLQAEITQIEARHDRERTEWRNERDEMHDRIDELSGQVMALQLQLRGGQQ